MDRAVQPGGFFHLAAGHQPDQALCDDTVESGFSCRPFLFLPNDSGDVGFIMKILVNAIPMTGLLTGIARYLRNLYHTIHGMGRADIRYFNGNCVVDAMPPMADAGRWQKTVGAVRYLPDHLVFGIRAARWMKYEYYLNRVCQNEAPGFSVYHETAFSPARLTRVPTVFSIYDLSLRRYKETHPKERVLFFEHFIKTRLRYARHILTISEFIRQEIISEFKVAPSMVTAVPLAADPVFTPADKKVVAQVRQNYNLPPSYLLFVSSLEPRKNIDILLDALVETKTDIPIVLVGWKGWGEKSWFEKIKNLKNRVYLTGHIPDHDLRAVYTGAQALIYPSLYEGFGLPIVEAMACGCPVICSNISSMPEVAGDAAVLIDPLQSNELAQAIENVVYDTDVRNRLVEKGKQRALDFTWESTAGQTLDVYRNVVK